MSLFSFTSKSSCTVAAVIAGVIIGVIAAFLQITGVVTVAPVVLAVTFGIAIVYLGLLVTAMALVRRSEPCSCMCTALNALLVGLLGTILLSAILLVVGVVATSLISALLVGLLLFFFTLTLASTACLIRRLADCEDE